MSKVVQLKINRKKEVLSRFGYSKSTIHNRINQGLIPPPISLGVRAVGWLEHEINQVIAAMAAGKSDVEIKALVAELVLERKDAA